MQKRSNWDDFDNILPRHPRRKAVSLQRIYPCPGERSSGILTISEYRILYTPYLHTEYTWSHGPTHLQMNWMKYYSVDEIYFQV